MKKFFATMLIVASLTVATIVCAAVQVYSGSGQYIMSDFENQDIAKQRAQQRAERDAQKKAGVYLQTYSRSVNAKLTDDEISAVTNNIINISDVEIKAEPFEVDGVAGIMYTATLKAQIDPDGIFEFIKRDDKSKLTIVSQNNSLQDAVAKNDEQIANLKERYQNATSEVERYELRKQLDIADKDFLANQKFEEANKLYYVKDFNGAIKFYRLALEFGDYPEVYNNRGNAYDELGKYEWAVQDYDKAIELNPNLYQAYNNRGTAHKNLGNYQQAIQDFNKTIELNPNEVAAYYNRGILYFEFGQCEAAVSDFDKVIELNPNDLEAYTNRGCVYGVLGDNQRALADFNKALELNPNSAEVYTNRAYTYFSMKDYQKTIADCNKALKINPNYANAYANRAEAYYELKKYKRAFADLNKAIELGISGMNLAEALHYRGLCHKATGKDKEAQADFDKALELGYSG